MIVCAIYNVSERSRPGQTAWYSRAAEPKPLNLMYDLEIQQQTYRIREYLEASDCGVGKFCCSLGWSAFGAMSVLCELLITHRGEAEELQVLTLAATLCIIQRNGASLGRRVSII